MMLDKLALKRLTASDLTFFEWHFRNRNAGNQKAINLNADVFTGQLYPALDTGVRERNNKLGVDLWIAGPDAAQPFNLQRKIIKGSAYKNWRLDGEFVHNPDDAPDRFNVLEPGDVALLWFDGDLSPDAVTLILVSQSADYDRELYRKLDGLLAGRGMMSVDGGELRKICSDLEVPQSHPVWRVVLEEDLTEAALGHAPAVQLVLAHWGKRHLSVEDLRKARRKAEETGQLGEELVNYFLKDRVNQGKIEKYQWVSSFNVVSPHDFRIRSNGKWEKLEVKTTRGWFGREFHLPFSELYDMVNGGEPYRIARVYRASVDGAKMRISCKFRDFGRTIMDAFDGLPDGVSPNGVTVVPEEEMFGRERELAAPPWEDD